MRYWSILTPFFLRTGAVDQLVMVILPDSVAWIWL